jgi:hypothetical protein
LECASKLKENIEMYQMTYTLFFKKEPFNNKNGDLKDAIFWNLIL